MQREIQGWLYGGGREEGLSSPLERSSKIPCQAESLEVVSQPASYRCSLESSFDISPYSKTSEWWTEVREIEEKFIGYSSRILSISSNHLCVMNSPDHFVTLASDADQKRQAALITIEKSAM